MERALYVCTFIVLQLFCSELLVSSAGMPLIAPVADEETLPGLPLQHRPRRKAGDMDTSAGPTEYMRQLYSRFADEEGSLRNAGGDPTSVWGILDEGIYTACTVLLHAYQLGGMARWSLHGVHMHYYNML